MIEPLGRIRRQVGVGGVGPVPPVGSALPTHSVRGSARPGMDTFSMAGVASRDPFGTSVRTRTGLEGAFTGTLSASGPLGLQGLAQAQSQGFSLRSNLSRKLADTSEAILSNFPA